MKEEAKKRRAQIARAAKLPHVQRNESKVSLTGLSSATDDIYYFHMFAIYYVHMFAFFKAIFTKNLYRQKTVHIFIMLVNTFLCKSSFYFITMLIFQRVVCSLNGVLAVDILLHQYVVAVVVVVVVVIVAVVVGCI